MTVALDSVRTAGSSPHAALETVIFAATAADVTDVIVDGRPVVVDRHHVSIYVAAELDASISAVMDS